MVTVVSLAKRSERPSLVIVNRRLPGNGEGQLPTELTQLWSELLPTIISSAFSLRSTTSGAVSSSANGPVASADASAPCYVSFEPPGAMGRFHYYASQPPLTAYDTPGPVAGRDWHARPSARRRQDLRCLVEGNRVRGGRRRSGKDIGRGARFPSAGRRRPRVPFRRYTGAARGRSAMDLRLLDRGRTSAVRLQRGLAYAAYDRALLAPGKGRRVVVVPGCALLGAGK